MISKAIANSQARIDPSDSPALMFILKKLLPSSFFFKYSPLSEKEMQVFIKENRIRVPCNRLHDDNCSVAVIKKAFYISKASSKFYLLIHLFSLLVFQRQKLQENPKKMIRKMIIGYVKSQLFIMGMMAGAKIMFCSLQYIPEKYSKSYEFLVQLFFSNIWILLESNSRINVLSMYILPRTLEGWIKYYSKTHLITNKNLLLVRKLG